MVVNVDENGFLFFFTKDMTFREDDSAWSPTELIGKNFPMIQCRVLLENLMPFSASLALTLQLFLLSRTRETIVTPNFFFVFTFQTRAALGEKSGKKSEHLFLISKNVVNLIFKCFFNGQ